MLQMEYSPYAVTIVKFVNEVENEIKKNKIAEAKDYDYRLNFSSPNCAKYDVES